MKSPKFSARACRRRLALGACCLALGAWCQGPPRQAPYGLDVDFQLQIALERQMFSMNVIDGAWGAKSKAALAAWLEAYGGAETPTNHADVLELVLSREPVRPAPYRLRRVTEGDAKGLVAIPSNPAEKMQLPSMGYETLLEKFAELGHTSQSTMRRLNPHAHWPNPPPGTVIRLPNVATTNKPPRAALVKVNLARRQVAVFDADGIQTALFPCSIAADKAKRPPSGEIFVKGIAPHPNYTYTSERPDHRGRHKKYIYPSGPNNPVGAAWVGLSIPSYGIHGTPNPESIGRAESHGCFRLANWNAERLRDMVVEGCKVVIE